MKILFFSLCALTLFSANAMELKRDLFSIHHNTTENIIITYFIDEFERCYKRTTVIKDRKNNSFDVYYTSKDKNDDMAPEFDEPADGYYKDKEDLLKKFIEQFECEKGLQK